MNWPLWLAFGTYWLGLLVGYCWGHVEGAKCDRCRRTHGWTPHRECER